MIERKGDSMSSEQTRSIHVERDIRAYCTFFDHEWARAILAEADRAGLSQLVFDLCAGWKGAANTAAFPWIVVESLMGFADGFIYGRKPYASTFMDALAAKVVEGIRPRLSAEQMASLQANIHDLNTDLLRELHAQPHPFDRQTLFDQLLATSEFQIAVVASQATVYAALYYTFEDFVLSCFKLGPV